MQFNDKFLHGGTPLPTAQIVYNHETVFARKYWIFAWFIRFTEITRFRRITQITWFTPLFPRKAQYQFRSSLFKSMQGCVIRFTRVTWFTCVTPLPFSPRSAAKVSLCYWVYSVISVYSSHSPTLFFIFSGYREEWDC